MAKNNKKDTNFAMAFLGVGMSVATEIAVATGLGYLLDRSKNGLATLGIDDICSSVSWRINDPCDHCSQAFKQ